MYIGFGGTITSEESHHLDDVTLYETLISKYSGVGVEGTVQDEFRNQSMRCWKNILDKLSAIAEVEDLELYEIVFCGYSFSGATAAIAYVRMKIQRLKCRRNEKQIF